MSSSRRMEQVFYQAHIKASNYILRHTTHRTRSIIEHLALGLAVCSFCVVIITHRAFIHREDVITPRCDAGGSFSSKAASSCHDDAAHHYYSDYHAAANYSLIVEGRNVSIYSILVQLLLRVTAWCTRRLHISSTTATTTTTTPTSALWSKKIPISCLKSIPGFRNDADVNHILLHLVTHDNTTADITNHGHVKERGGGGGGGGRGSRSSAFTIHRGHENEQIVVVSSMPPYSCIIDSYNGSTTTVDACSREMTTFLARRGYLSVHVNNNANDHPLLLFQKEEKEKLPIAHQQHQQQQHSPILYSYSHTQGLLRLQPSLQHKHNISTQFIIVSPTDVNCFGEPFTQNIIFRFIGPDTVILNWILGLQSPFSSSHSSTSTTATTTIHRRPRFVHHWKTHKELDLDIYDMDHYAFSSKSTRRTDAAAAATTTMYEAVSPSLPVATMNMLLSSSSSPSSWVCGKRYPFYRLIRFLSFKLLVLASTLLIFFLTTSLVSFTFQETQDRMLEFTFQLQSRVRANLPLGTLIFDHVLENLVFVPIMVGMIFFLIEFYGDDKFLAFMVLSMVWVCEVFSAISVRSVQGMHFFPRVFFLYFTLFHVYFFSCPVGFTYASLASTILFLFHTMLFFWNRYELPAVHAGLITPQSPRMLRLGIDRDRGVEGEVNTGRAVPPSPSRIQSSYLQMPVLQRHQQHPRLNVIPRMNSDDDDRSSVTAPTVPLSTTARSSRLSRTDDSSNDLLTPDSNPQSSLLFAAPSYPGPMRSYVAAASTSLQSIRSMASFHSLTSLAGGRTSPNYIFEGGYNYGDNSEGDCDDSNEEELTL